MAFNVYFSVRAYLLKINTIINTGVTTKNNWA